MKRRIAIVLLIVAAMVSVAEVCARRALPPVPGSRTVSRNPFRFRGWPEFIRDGLAPATNHTVVLLGNSQAYAGEYPADHIYAAGLAQRLNERAAGGHRDWQVLNWSADGMNSIEYVLLARALAARPPDLVLAPTGFADYSREHLDQGFQYCRTDVPRLAARYDILRGLPGAYLRRHLKIEDWLTLWAGEHLAIYRCRDFLWSWLDGRLPGAQTMLYSPRVNYAPWEMPRVAPWTSEPGWPDAPRPNARFTYDESSRPMLQEYVRTLRALGGCAVLVAQPRRLEKNDGARRLMDRAFARDLAAAAAARGVPLWDLRNSLPAEDFITSSHLRGPNHQRFADLLADRIVGRLGGEPAPAKAADAADNVPVQPGVPVLDAP